MHSHTSPQALKVLIAALGFNAGLYKEINIIVCAYIYMCADLCALYHISHDFSLHFQTGYTAAEHIIYIICGRLAHSMVTQPRLKVQLQQKSIHCSL